jgi:hypothetical protein
LDTEQDTGTLRVTIREAAAKLGVTEAAIRKRIQRGSLGKELGKDGRVYVYLDLSRDMSHPESQIHRDPVVEELVEELRDRVAFLERSLEGRSVEAERYQQIVAGLTQTNNQLASRLRELEAPQEPPGFSETDAETAARDDDAPDYQTAAQDPRSSPLKGWHVAALVVVASMVIFGALLYLAFTVLSP